MFLKSYTDNFDVPMGSYDSAQIADLMGIYILDTLGRIRDLKIVGLYGDDGHIFIAEKYTSKIHTKSIRAFKLLGFKIEIAPNLKIVNFLYITFN